MDEAKKKRLDDRLKQLIAESDSAQNENNRPANDTSSQSRASGNVSVIRRRKGKPDHSIVS